MLNIHQRRIDRDEERDIRLLQNAFKLNCKRQNQIFAMPRGSRYDAEYYQMNNEGKMKLRAYLEIKCREDYREGDFDTCLLQMTKSDKLNEIQEEDKVPTFVIIIYPEDGCYYSYQAKEIEDFDTKKVAVKKLNVDEDSPKVLQDFYLLPLEKNRRWDLHFVGKV